MAGARGIRRRYGSFGIFCELPRSKLLRELLIIEPPASLVVVFILIPSKNPTQGRALTWQGLLDDYRTLIDLTEVENEKAMPHFIKAMF